MHEQHYKELILPSELQIYYNCQKTTIEHIGSMRNSTAPPSHTELYTLGTELGGALGLSKLQVASVTAKVHAGQKEHGLKI